MYIPMDTLVTILATGFVFFVASLFAVHNTAILNTENRLEREYDEKIRATREFYKMKK